MDSKNAELVFLRAALCADEANFSGVLEDLARVEELSRADATVSVGALTLRISRSRAATLLELGSARDAIDLLAAQLNVSRYAKNDWQICALHGRALGANGEWERAVAALSRGLLIARRLASGVGIVACLTARSWATLMAGRVYEAREDAVAAVAAADEGVVLRGASVSRLLLTAGAAAVACGAVVDGLRDLVTAAMVLEALSSRSRARSAVLRESAAAAAEVSSVSSSAPEPSAGAMPSASATAAFKERKARREMLGRGNLAPELAGVFSEKTPARDILTNFGGEYGGVGGVSYAAGRDGAGHPRVRGIREVESDGDTDEDTFSDAERERSLALCITRSRSPRTKGGASSPPAPSSRPASREGGATSEGSVSGGRGGGETSSRGSVRDTDDSDARSVATSQTSGSHGLSVTSGGGGGGASGKGVFRNMGFCGISWESRATIRARIADRPPSTATDARAHVWPAQPPPFSLPPTAALATDSAWIHFFSGVAYEKLAAGADEVHLDSTSRHGGSATGAIENAGAPPRPTPPLTAGARAMLARAALHYERATNAWPGCVPAAARGAFVAAASGHHAAAVDVLSKLLDGHASRSVAFALAPPATANGSVRAAAATPASPPPITSPGRAKTKRGMTEELSTHTHAATDNHALFSPSTATRSYGLLGLATVHLLRTGSALGSPSEGEDEQPAAGNNSAPGSATATVVVGARAAEATSPLSPPPMSPHSVAATSLDGTAAADSAFASLLLARGLSLLALRRAAEAVDDLSAAVDLLPNAADRGLAHRARGASLLWLRRVPAARRAFAAARREGHNTPGLASAIARADLYLGAWESAAAEATRALRLACGCAAGDAGESSDAPVSEDAATRDPDVYVNDAFAPPPAARGYLTQRAAAFSALGDATRAARDLSEALQLLYTERATAAAVVSLGKLKAAEAAGAKVDPRDMENAVAAAAGVRPRAPAARRASLDLALATPVISGALPPAPTDLSVRPSLCELDSVVPTEWHVGSQLAATKVALDDGGGAADALRAALAALAKTLPSGVVSEGDPSVALATARKLSTPRFEARHLRQGVAFAAALHFEAGVIAANADDMVSARDHFSKTLSLVAPLLTGDAYDVIGEVPDAEAAAADITDATPKSTAAALRDAALKAAAARIVFAPLRVSVADEDDAAASQEQRGPPRTTLPTTKSKDAAVLPVASPAGRDAAAGAAIRPPLSRAELIAVANAAAPADLVRLRLCAAHERAKVLQVLGAHRDAIADFDVVLESAPATPTALFRRALVKRTLGDFAGAADDAEGARRLRRDDARFQLNYVGLDCRAIVLCAAGEEDALQIIGVDGDGCV